MLTEINLCSCEMSEEASELFADALDDIKLRKLVVGDNDFTWQALARLLSNQNTLEHLADNPGGSCESHWS